MYFYLSFAFFLTSAVPYLLYAFYFSSLHRSFLALFLQHKLHYALFSTSPTPCQWRWTPTRRGIKCYSNLRLSKMTPTGPLGISAEF